MDKIAQMASDKRRELFMQTASRCPYLSEAAIEKDFWVCWILKQLFSSSLKDVIVFKGGTSLSKIFQLIKRFSEDIDLILNWKDNPVGDPSKVRSNAKQAKFNDELDSWGNHYIAEVLLPQIKLLCEDICKIEIQDGKPDSIVITYPKSFPDSYIRPQILLEIGAKAAWVPHETYSITSYAAEVFPKLFEMPTAAIVATTPERSFWEKITILHAEAHRPAKSRLRNRYSRHYYDTVMISRNSVKERAFADLQLLQQVVEFKDKFYHCNWANYKDARPGSMKLLPPEHSLKDLKSDYAAMRIMIYDDYLSFDELMDELQVLENEINSLQNKWPQSSSI